MKSCVSFFGNCVPKPQHLNNNMLAKVSRLLGHAGEDSFMCHQCGFRKHFVMAVADGVGHRKPEKERASALFSRKLMASASDWLAQFCSNLEHNSSDVSGDVLRHSASCVSKMAGASTVCVLEVDCGASVLRAANLGDSGFAVFRHGGHKAPYHPVFRSIVQERGFAIPFQLNTNSVTDAESATVSLENGDVIVLGTDGLWDNLFLHTIAGIITQELTDCGTDPRSRKRMVASGQLTNALLFAAMTDAQNPHITTPWSVAMTDKIDMVYSGGKTDDITCVVALFDEALALAAEDSSA